MNDSEEKIHIAPLADLTANCPNVQRHLRTYCENPERFDDPSLAVMNWHLQECTTCQKQLSDVGKLVREKHP